MRSIRFCITGMVILFAVAQSGIAHGSVLNFATLAATRGEGIMVPNSATFGGFKVTATATRFGSSANTAPYLDGLSGGLPGGLGACLSDCVGTNNDSVNKGEIISLAFSTAVGMTPTEVTLDQTTFIRGNHSPDFFTNNKINIQVDGGGFDTFFLKNFSSVLTGTTFDFKFNNVPFYVNEVSAVPLPPAIWLFLSALIGLAGVVRVRRKYAA